MPSLGPEARAREGIARPTPSPTKPPAAERASCTLAQDPVFRPTHAREGHVADDGKAVDRHAQARARVGHGGMAGVGRGGMRRRFGCYRFPLQ